MVTADIVALKDESLSGVEKFAKALATTTPMVFLYVACGGLSAVTHEAEGIARELVQSLYNDMIGATKASGAAAPPAPAALAQAA